jgi:hypothetical protein
VEPYACALLPNKPGYNWIGKHPVTNVFPLTWGKGQGASRLVQVRYARWMNNAVLLQVLPSREVNGAGTSSVSR